MPSARASLAPKILVADDDDLVRLSTCAMLNHLGCVAVGARDGQEAVEMFASGGNSFALVLLDIHMPRKSGLEASREIRHLDPGARIAYCTGELSISRIMEAAPAEAALRKPYGLTDLQDLLETLAV